MTKPIHIIVRHEYNFNRMIECFALCGEQVFQNYHGVFLGATVKSTDLMEHVTCTKCILDYPMGETNPYSGKAYV